MKKFEIIIRKCEMYSFGVVMNVASMWNSYFDFDFGNEYLSIKDVRRCIMWLGYKERAIISYVNNRKWLDNVGVWKNGKCICKLCLIIDKEV